MLHRVAFSSRLILLIGFVLGIFILELGQISVPLAKADGSVVTLGETSGAGPALTSFNGRLHLAWTGTDNAHSLNVISSSDGINFGNKVTLGESSIAGPALTSFNGRLYLAWTGTDDAHSLNVISSSDGITFGNKVTLGDTSIAGPALTSSSSMLLLGWTGTDSAHSLNVISSSDGITFSGKATLGESSIAAPALAGSAGGFSLAWTGTDSAHSLNIIRALGGTKETLSDTSNLAPALTIFNGQLALAWTGTDSASRLNVRSFDLTAGQTSQQNTFTWQWPAVVATQSGQICLPIVGCLQIWSVNQAQGFPADVTEGVQRLGVQSARRTESNLPDGLTFNLNIASRSATLSGTVSGNIGLSLVYDLLNGSGSKVGTLTVLINILSGGGSPVPQPPPPGGSTCNPCTVGFEGMIQGAAGILTIVSGVTIAVNGVAHTTPFSISAASGTPLTLQAQTSITLSGVTYKFSQWRSSVTGPISTQNPVTGVVDRDETIQAVYAQGGGSGGMIKITIRATGFNGADLSGEFVPTITGSLGAFKPPKTFNLPAGTSLTLIAPQSVGGGCNGPPPLGCTIPLQFQYWLVQVGASGLASSDPTESDTPTMNTTYEAVYK